METLSNENSSSPGTGRIVLAGLLAIQAIIGYVWLMSGLTKVFRGGFPSGLADELTEKSEGIGGWYKSFLDGTVIPNAEVFGWLIMLGELAVGVALIVAAVVWFLRWERLSYRGKLTLLAVAVVASVGAILMNLNFHLANGSAHPWLIPEDGFDEGVDLDSIMPLVQLALAAVSAKLLVALRRERRQAIASVAPPRPARDGGGTAVSAAG
jgi:hypothetical protein